MVVNSKLDKQNVVAAFNEMSFGEAVESTKLAEEWLSKKNIKLNEEVIFSSATPYQARKEHDPIAKYHFYQEIVGELKENVRLLAEMEMFVRGFTYKDAVKSINYFLDTLLFYSTCRNVFWSSSVCYSAVPLNSVLSCVAHFIGMYDFFHSVTIFLVDSKLAIILSAIRDIIRKQCEIYKIDLLFETKCELEINSRTPVLVFNGADLDSACESIVNAAFAEQGLMPWSVNTVLVQENIINDVIAKLKRRLSQVRFGKGVDKQVDFAVPYLLSDYMSKFKETLAVAESKGIEVFRSDDNSMAALFVGGKVYNNSVINEKQAHVPYLNVLGFRGINEAVALCNNQQQNFAAGVWANDVGLVHEIIHNLNVSRVWINTHGIFRPGDYGANVGLLLPLVETIFQGSYNTCKKAQKDWFAKGEQGRINHLFIVTTAVANKLKSSNKMAQHMQQLILSAQARGSKVSLYGQYEVKQLNSPSYRVICNNLDFRSNFVSAISALLGGNVVFLGIPSDLEDTVARSFCSELKTLFPNLFYTACIPTNILIDIEPEYKTIWTAIGENYV